MILQNSGYFYFVIYPLEDETIGFRCLFYKYIHREGSEGFVSVALLNSPLRLFVLFILNDFTEMEIRTLYLPIINIFSVKISNALVNSVF